MMHAAKAIRCRSSTVDVKTCYHGHSDGIGTDLMGSLADRPRGRLRRGAEVASGHDLPGRQDVPSLAGQDVCNVELVGHFDDLIALVRKISGIVLRPAPPILVGLTPRAPYFLGDLHQSLGYRAALKCIAR
jgi:glutamate-1-semialdehyde aminotransferase